MRDAWGKFVDNDIKLYAVSYDDRETLGDFAREQEIPYPLLSDVDSEVIRRYGILNTQVSSDDAFLYGIPFPGVYVVDEQGRVVAKSFHDSYKKRDSAETLIDAALGRIQLSDDAPITQGGEDDIRITVAVHGGNGSIRQGIVRKLVVRFELADGLHIYGEPVPQGMVATGIDVEAPPGFVVLPMEAPPTHPLHLPAMAVDLEVWSGTVDLVIPFYPHGEQASEVRALDNDSIDIAVTVRYQACNDQECLLPRTETLHLTLPMDVVDVPRLGMHLGHGQREGSYDSTPAMKRLIWRKFKQNPLGFGRFILKSIGLEWQARKRARQQK